MWNSYPSWNQACIFFLLVIPLKTEGFGLDDRCGSLPTQDIIWFCEYITYNLSHWKSWILVRFYFLPEFESPVC